MGIAKEIFGLRKLGKDNDHEQLHYEHVGHDDLMDYIDSFEISEDVIAEIIKDCVSKREYGEGEHFLFIARAIKANANKIFVRKK